jgi:hypothetical protein
VADGVPRIVATDGLVVLEHGAETFLEIVRDEPLPRTEGWPMRAVAAVSLGLTLREPPVRARSALESGVRGLVARERAARYACSRRVAQSCVVLCRSESASDSGSNARRGISVT